MPSACVLHFISYRDGLLNGNSAKFFFSLEVSLALLPTCASRFTLFFGLSSLGLCRLCLKWDHEIQNGSTAQLFTLFAPFVAWDCLGSLIR